MNALRNKLAHCWPALLIALFGYAVLDVETRSRLGPFILGFIFGALLLANSYPPRMILQTTHLYGALVDILNVYYERYAPTGRLGRISEDDAAKLVDSAQKVASQFKETMNTAPLDLQYAMSRSPRWRPGGMRQ